MISLLLTNPSSLTLPASTVTDLSLTVGDENVDWLKKLVNFDITDSDKGKCGNSYSNNNLSDSQPYLQTNSGEN